MNPVVPTVTPSPEFFTAVAGLILAVLFAYVPKLNTWYGGQSEEFKKLFMLGLLLLTAVGVYILACVQIVNVEGFVCQKKTALDFFWMFVYALFSNQGLYLVLPKAPAVKEAIAERNRALLE